MKKILVVLIAFLLFIPLQCLASSEITSDEATELMRACYFGDLPKVESAIAAQANLHAVDARGNPPLFYAVLGENCGLSQLVVRLLIAADVTVVHAVNTAGYTSVMCAAIKSRLGIMRLLLATGVDVLSKTSEGNTVLRLGIKTGREELVQALIDAGAAVDEPDSNGCTPLMYAASRGYVHIVKNLLRAGADLWATDQLGHTALKYAQGRAQVLLSRLYAKRGERE
jgi:ankyrin repeat protein